MERALDLAFNLVAIEERHWIFVAFELVLILRHDLLNEGKSFVVGCVGINEYFADVVAQVVADRANNNVTFLQQECRCFTLLSGAGNRIPKVDQVIQVGLKFFA